MQIEILGSLTATANGNTFIPSAMKPRQLLALLIANSNRHVPSSAIAKELWGTTPPRSAANTVQTYVMQIRKLLESALAGNEGAHATDILVTGASGYQLSADPADIDLTRYLGLASEGESALLNREYARAAHAFADALAVWRDNALCNVRPGPMLDTFVRELEDSRTITLERRIEAELCLGQHYGVLRELTELTRNHPLNENLHSQFILALYRAGRRVQALKVYQKLRKRMTDELGLDPSPRLQQLQTAVLNCDGSLEFNYKACRFSPEIAPTYSTARRLPNSAFSRLTNANSGRIQWPYGLQLTFSSEKADIHDFLTYDSRTRPGAARRPRPGQAASQRLRSGDGLDEAAERDRVPLPRGRLLRLGPTL